MILLETILQKEKPKYPVGLSDDELFEYYCADNILVNYDLDANEIESGLIDGPRDAGVDAAYVFVNTHWVAEDFAYDAIREPVELELYLIQSKNQDSFKESPVDKLTSSLPLLLDHTKKAKDLEPLFKKEVVTVCQTFLEAMNKLADRFPKISIRLFYCCKGGEPNDTTKAKAAALEMTLKGMQFQHVQFTFLGSQKLYDRSAIQKNLVSKLSTTGTPLSGANSYVGLSKLSDYLRFITDDSGSLITRIFEANVRAYQGEVEVNREIASSLKMPTAGLDFWWLNNGVTIVADEASYMNNQLVIKNPLIVNGLQTSNEIHAFANTLQGDARSILVRVIVEQDSTKRDQIIRATNRQTSISSSSFRATEPVHREIEDYLLPRGFFYDRRKNAYKREGRPADKIISIDRLAQAILSLLLQEPHTARARPTSAIKVEADYKRIFSGDKSQQPLQMYGAAIQMLDHVERHFKSVGGGGGSRIYRNNLKFHTLMVLGWALNQNATLPALRIAQLDLNKMTDQQVKKVAEWVFSEFTAAGPEDKTAKDSAFTDRLKANWSVAVTKPDP